MHPDSEDFDSKKIFFDNLRENVISFDVARCDHFFGTS